MARNGNAKTKHVALNMLKAGVAIFGAALLFACGDDDSSFVASENGGSAAEADIVVATFDYLPNCTDKREGKTAYIKDEKTAYVCTDGDWVVAGETGNEGDGDDDDGDDAEKKSSSSTAKSADSKDKSSSDKEVSSSSVTQSSSSSVTLSEVEGSSSSSVIPGSDPESSSSDELSSSSRGLFEMSKDEFLNPKVSYGEMTDSRDNQVYKTVEICNNETSTCQTWMAENLNYSVNPNVQSWCGGGERDYAEGDCSVYGRLYTWAAAVGKSENECGYGKTCNLLSGDIRGVCPEGWHLPSYDEWDALIKAVGGTSYAGQKLKADSDLWTSEEGVSNDDSFGFAVLPAGNRNYTGSFLDEGNYASFWSSTEDNSGSAYNWDFYYDDDRVFNFWDYKYSGFSVRCLRDSN